MFTSKTLIGVIWIGYIYWIWSARRGLEVQRLHLQEVSTRVSAIAVDQYQDLIRHGHEKHTCPRSNWSHPACYLARMIVRAHYELPRFGTMIADRGYSTSSFSELHVRPTRFHLHFLQQYYSNLYVGRCKLARFSCLGEQRSTPAK